MNKYWILGGIIFISLTLASLTVYEETLFIVDGETSVADVLEQLGDTPSSHKPKLTLPDVSVENGQSLVLEGIIKKAGGGTTEKQSKHFVCTSCHNIQREDPDLSKSDPQARLLYVKQNGLPFLQGTTLYGAVNRESFYNGDYEKKYGSLVEKARTDIREAIQLCAVECSQGRPLEDWEMESVLAYLWTIDLKLKDLDLTEPELGQLNKSLSNKTMTAESVNLIRSKYLKGSPATFINPPENRNSGYALKGDANNGKLIYELSCLHCHDGERYSFFNLDNATLTFKFLKKHFPRYTRYSVYQVSRYGTSPKNGRKAYMPNYTIEKMNNQQMEDLRAYIEEMAK